MCGRFRIKDPKKASEYFDVQPAFDFRPRYNIAPTQKIAVVSATGKIEEMRWGLIPAWAKETSKALINARSETVREKRSFKKSFTERRCLVPADGFYEWTKIDKRPHLFGLRDEEPFAIAGFWDEDPEMNRCCLLTTEANSVLQPIHDRMPIILRKEYWEQWMEPGELNDERFQRFTAPFQPEQMFAREVSKVVNSARIDDAKCCEPVVPALL